MQWSSGPLVRACLVVVAWGQLLTAAGCSTRSDRPAGEPHGWGGPAIDAGADAAEAGAPDTGTPVEPEVDAGQGVPERVLVYAHSRDTLFAFDPITLAVRNLGQFQYADGSPAPQMTDLAVNDRGEVYTCSRTELFRVNASNATATQVAALAADGPRFNGLTFLPAGVLDADRETLVGDTDTGDLFRIDLATGQTVRVSTYTHGFVSSGDLVSVEGAGTFGTVKRRDLDTDMLVRIEPRTGAVTPIGTGIGYQRVFGLGYFRSRLFGFLSDGGLIEIDIRSGVGTPLDVATGTDEFWGAGVTTLAPVGPF